MLSYSSARLARGVAGHKASSVILLTMAQSDLQAAVQSDGHLVRALKWPIIVVLALTSFPAGGSVPLFIGSYREWRQQSAAAGGSHAGALRDFQRTKADNELTSLYVLAAVWAVLMLVHLSLAAACWNRWNGLFLGFRGAGWFALLWGTFAGGLVVGSVLAIDAAK